MNGEWRAIYYSKDNNKTMYLAYSKQRQDYRQTSAQLLFEVPLLCIQIHLYVKTKLKYEEWQDY